jgi:hypothetical protein
MILNCPRLPWYCLLHNCIQGTRPRGATAPTRAAVTHAIRPAKYRYDKPRYYTIRARLLLVPKKVKDRVVEHSRVLQKSEMTRVGQDHQCRPGNGSRNVVRVFQFH